MGAEQTPSIILMNQTHQNETEAIRSDIDSTRNRMDDTIDALGSRLQPRHLLDEVLGFFRRHESEAQEKFTHVRESLSHSSEAAMNTVVDTVKKNPLPLLLIGAGVAWMIYSNRKSSSMDYSDYDYDQGVRDDIRYDPDAHIDRPLDYPASGTGISEAGWSESGTSKLGEMKETASQKFSQARETARHKMDDLRHTAQDKMEAARNRASEIGSRVKERTEEVYSRTRDRVTTTADQHPLELGLVCLATGLVAGLLVPTAEVVNRRLGPTADRLRDRSREAGQEMMEKGKRVADAAVSAAKEEAEAQGLTAENIGDKASAVANRGTEAGKQKARDEGLSGSLGKPDAGNRSGIAGMKPEGNNPMGTPATDPTVARPAI